MFAGRTELVAVRGTKEPAKGIRTKPGTGLQKMRVRGKKEATLELTSCVSRGEEVQHKREGERRFADWAFHEFGGERGKRSY